MIALSVSLHGWQTLCRSRRTHERVVGPAESCCSRRSATPESGAPCAFPPGVNGLAVREAPARDGGEERERNDRGEPVSEAARLLDKLL